MVAAVVEPVALEAPHQHAQRVPVVAVLSISPTRRLLQRMVLEQLLERERQVRLVLGSLYLRHQLVEQVRALA